MPINCTFLLNNQPLTSLSCSGVGTFAAFSGMPADRNNPAAEGNAESGPLPRGRYYILDRQSGGHLGWLYDFLRTHGYGIPTAMNGSRCTETTVPSTM
ncbi:tlde1 domain-containing protein [Paraburkholderia sp. NMBU_R16]|uniref:tlde1 domain-containing protein n=1 Tax=Paraburkholderia sp. NMBU_R16 TaxID=2698676 RepID=UPI00349F479E